MDGLTQFILGLIVGFCLFVWGSSELYTKKDVELAVIKSGTSSGQVEKTLIYLEK